MAGKAVDSADPNAAIRDATADLRRQVNAGAKVTTPVTEDAARRYSRAPQPPAPPLSDDMRDGDNDGGKGTLTRNMPEMPGPLPGGK